MIDNDLRALIDASYLARGQSPWTAYHRPRLHARIAAQDALMAQVRADAMRVQGKPLRDGRGRLVGFANTTHQEDA